MHFYAKNHHQNPYKYLNEAVGDDTIELSSHGDMKTLTTHYIDAEIVAKGLTMKMF